MEVTEGMWKLGVHDMLNHILREMYYKLGKINMKTKN